MWPSHFRQYGSFVAKMSDLDWDILQIIQSLIDKLPWEKALQATAEDVSYGQLAIRNGAIAKANSQAVDLATFNAKSDIKAALSLVPTQPWGAAGPYCEESA